MSTSNTTKKSLCSFLLIELVGTVQDLYYKSLAKSESRLLKYGGQ